MEQGGRAGLSALLHLLRSHGHRGPRPLDELVKTYEVGAINEAFAYSADGPTIKPVVAF
ncbi:hypothetical protein ACFYQA_31500 [Streptomyces sp. NPDC005774]|uniref:hypothetical protein n=1 Tax=Streptomyces sp. NPDC005774 TaxID=3364728 RepID=UPI0036802CBB